MKWFKKVAHLLTGLLATSAVVGCSSTSPTTVNPTNDAPASAESSDMDALRQVNQPGADVPMAIYGPAPEDTAVPAYPGDMDALREANQSGADVPMAIYGPAPEDTAVPAYPGDMDALREANQPGADVPVAIYGPAPDMNAVPAYPGDTKADEEAKKDEANQEIGELRKADERAIRALYGVRPPVVRQ